MDMGARIQALVQRQAAIEKSIEMLKSALTSQCEKQRTAATSAPAAARHCDQCDLKELQPCPQDTPQVAALRRWCIRHSLTSAVFRWVSSDYYQKTLQWRRDVLAAPSVHHLCKTILMENTHCVHQDCSVRDNSRYYLIVYPYTEKFDAEMLLRHVKGRNEGLGKKKFNFRLASPEVALKLTGFGHGAVAPFGTTMEIPVIISDRILKLTPAVFWMGGGHVDCKVRVGVEQFVEVVKPIIASFTTPLSAEELEKLVD